LMKGNRLAEYYTSQAMSALNADLAQAFAGILQTQLLRYVQLPEVRKQIDSSGDFHVQLKAVLDIFPSFIFVVISELAGEPGACLAVRRLQMAGILFVMDRTQTYQLHIQLFIDGLRQKEKLQLSEKAGSDTETLVLPEVVFRDFMTLAERPVRFQPTKSSPEMIENLYCFSGLSQIFLRYFFDLFAAAGDERLVQQINAIFSKLFVSLRLEEIRFWKGYKNAAVIQKRLQDTIEANSPKTRHPKLQKDVFADLASYHPIIHNGTSRGMSSQTQALLKEQLAAFLAFSTIQLALLLNIVLRFKGDDHAVYLISQLIKSDKERLQELHAYLMQLQQKPLQGLQTLVESFVKRFFPSQTPTAPAGKPESASGVQYSQESVRLAQAKKNLEALGDRTGMMTHDKVARYLEERLKKLYEKVRRSGALTADMVPRYLERFAAAAQKVLVEVSPVRQKELIEAFEASTDDILNEITRFSEMSPAEVDSIRADIHEKMGELATPDLNRRSEVVEEIGIALSDVSEKVDPPQPPSKTKTDPPQKAIDVAAILANEQVSIGFDEKAPFVPLGEFFKLPFGERKGPPEDDWFVFHKKYLALAAEHKRLKASILEVIPEIERQIPKLKYRKYFNIFPNGEYEDPTCSAVYDIWKSNALKRLRID